MTGDRLASRLRRTVRDIAVRIPPELKALRSKLMLERVCETLGVEEVPCPACDGTGWLRRDCLEYCPVCCGFREVPDRLANWFKCQFCRTREADGAGRRSAQSDRAAAGRRLVEGQAPLGSTHPRPAARYGRERFGEVRHRVRISHVE